MKQIFAKTSIAVAALVMMATTGCEPTKKLNNTQKGAGIGAAAGGVLGGVIGNNVGNKNNTILGAVLGAAVGGVVGGVIGNKMDRQAEAIKEEIPGAEVQRVGEGINVTFSENNPDGSKMGVFFNTGQFNISANSKIALDKLVKVFNMYPETNILIEGHTDDVGSDGSNMTLSQKRAGAVGSYLKEAGINSNRLTVKWYGETQPKVANTNDAGRAENRRVEFGITANEKMKADAAKEAQNN
ncbi:MAG: OmpA family protein [Chitinophagaceae bacterium]|nr:OmpA family protein [Chitinophagaceae bacterium]